MRWLVALALVACWLVSGAAYADVRIRAGSALTDSAGNAWASDSPYVNGGQLYTDSGLVSGTSDPALYLSHRYGSLTYRIPASGQVNVVLHFAEVYFTQAGQRVFAVTVEGQPYTLDILALAGPRSAYRLSVPVTVSDGELTIQLTTGVANNPMVSAIEVVQVVEVPPPPQFFPQLGLSHDKRTVNINEGDSLTLTWTSKDMESCVSSWRGPVEFSGSDTLIPPKGWQTFQIICDGKDGLKGYSAKTSFEVHAWKKPPPPRCKPAKTWHAKTVDGHDAGFGYCDDENGYQTRRVGAAPDEPMNFACRLAAPVAELLAVGLDDIVSAEWIDSTWNSCVTRPLTPTEDIVSAQLKERYGLRFVVSGTTTVPVYSRNEDGTRGPAVTVGGVAQRIAAGKPCEGASRLLGTTTRYHSVAGESSTTGVELPVGAYAQCTRKVPPAAGWT
jgi:hypothetical protein